MIRWPDERRIHAATIMFATSPYKEITMKRTLIYLAVTLMAMSMSFAVSARSDKEVTIKGEVVDQP